MFRRTGGKFSFDYFYQPKIDIDSSSQNSSNSWPLVNFAADGERKSSALVTGDSTQLQPSGFIGGGASLLEGTDIAASTATTATLSVGQSAQGTMGVLGDHDWYKVVLQAGHTYTFAQIGTGLNPLNDTFLSLRDSSGNVIASDDDSGPGTGSVIGMQSPPGGGVFTAAYSGNYYLDAGAYNNGSMGQYGISVIESSAATGYKPSFDTAMGAGALHAGAPLDWNQVSGTTQGQGITVTYSFRDTLTYTGEPTFSKCTTAEMGAVSSILTLLSDVCNISFTRIAPTGYSNDAQIVIANYYDTASAAGAYAYYPSTASQGGDLWLNTASVNPDTITQGQYSWFAIMHELGHALGLSHPGDYNAGTGTPTYANSAQFIEDSEQYSIMSYWGGSSTGQTPGNFATAYTPLLFDIYQLQTLYGVNVNTRVGDTSYGFNNTAGSSYLFSTGMVPYYCIWDAGGIDTLDASGYSQSQIINLAAGTFSNVGGGVSNVSIAVGAVIENGVGGLGNDTILGNSANNNLSGGSGNDVLAGNAGDDLMTGGLGTDYARYSYSLLSYTVSYDAALDTYTVTSGAEGTDTLFGIEYLRCLDGDYLLSGLLVPDTTAPTVTTFLPADGATLVAVDANVVLTFSEAIARGIGTISILAGSPSGTLVESFDAATSNRISISGSTLTLDPTNNLANDTNYYVVFSSGAITDLAGNPYAGIETYDFTTVTAGNLITGTAGADPLTGTSGVDIIYGFGGNDTITGAGGIDSLDGGEGSDLYLIATSADHGAAEIADTGLSGKDEVRFTSTTANSTLTLYAGDTGIEQAVIGTGTAATAVTSGTTALNINASALNYGISLIGNAGANVLTGGLGNDNLQGGAGNDTLNGGAGIDYADYSSATKSVTVNLSLSTAQNTGGAGSDTLSGVEGLKGGSAADKLTGDGNDNMLIGNAGNDTLNGGGGNDQLRGGTGNDNLTGGAGSDWFIFDTAPNARSNLDTITDFVSGTDQLQFSKAVFTGLALGNLTVDAFWSGAGVTAAHDASDRLIYNTTAGTLYYDADGSGGAAAVQVAIIGTATHPALLYSDISVVA